MTDPLTTTSTTTDSFPSSGPGAGELLRRAREASGLHIGALAVTLKVPVHRIEALESERWDLLPDAVYIRALASSVCRALKVDPAPVLLRLPRPNQRSIVVGASLNAPIRKDSSVGTPLRISSQFSRPLILAVGALLFATLALALYPTVQRIWSRPSIGAETPGELSTPYQKESTDSSPGRISSVSSASQPHSPGVSSQGIAASGIAALQQNSASLPASERHMPQTLDRSGDQSGDAVKDDIVVFRVKGPSWIQVNDATGAVVLKKELDAGESIGVSGVLPLAVVVGRADMTTVEVRGKPMDLAPLAKKRAKSSALSMTFAPPASRAGRTAKIFACPAPISS